MDIKYTGKFIEQKEKLDMHYKSIIKNYGENEKKLIYDIINNSNLEKKSNAIHHLKNDSNLKTFFEYSQIHSSYNKSKGQWIEDIMNYIFERTNLFEIKSKITWKDGIIINRLPLQYFKINNKNIWAYKPIKHKDFQKIKKINFSTHMSLNNLDKKICDFLDTNKKFKNNIDFIKYENQILSSAQYYNVDIKFKKSVSYDETFLNFLVKLKILSTFDFKKIKTDSTVQDIKNNRIFIIECKNLEKTSLQKEHIWKTISYAIREKEFNKKKFKKITIVYKGSLSEEIENELQSINTNFYSYSNTQLELIKLEDFLDQIKDEYFDDESKINYRKKNITAWDFNTITYKKIKGPRKYEPIFTLDKKLNNVIIINADYEYDFNSNYKDLEISKKASKKKDDELKELNKESMRLLE